MNTQSVLSEDMSNILTEELNNEVKLNNKQKPNFDLNKIQFEISKWNKRNFGEQNNFGYKSLLGIMEELGELVHAHLKQEEGIRINENHEANKKDAIGDILIFLLNYCDSQNYLLSDILNQTWSKVSKRNWQKNKINGEVTIE